MHAKTIDTNNQTNVPTLTKEEEKKYAAIASRDPQAKEAFEDLRVVSKLLAQIAQILPEKIELNLGSTMGTVDLELRNWAMPIIFSFYNVSEIGLSIINFMDTLEDPLVVNGKCVVFTDQELMDATKAGKRAAMDVNNFTIEQCLDIGCPNKRACIANLLRRSLEAFRPLFDNAVAKYNKDAKPIPTTEEGLLLNIEKAFENVIAFLLNLEPVKKKLAAQGWSDRTDKFIRQFAALRKATVVGAATFSVMLEALQILTVAIGGKEMIKYLPKDLQDAGEAVIKEGLTTEISPAEIDSMEDDFGFED